jgi:hypothetical protein
LQTEWGSGLHKSYLIPALEIPGFIVFLNGFDRLVHGDETEGGKKSIIPLPPLSGST